MRACVCVCVCESELERIVGNGAYEERQDDHTGGRVPSKRPKNKGGYLEKYPSFDRQLEIIKCFEKWSNVFMSAFAKNNFRCVVLNLLCL